MKKALAIGLFGLGNMIIGSTAAQIYSYVDADGQQVFTDRPPATASSETVELQTVNRMPAGQRIIKLQAPAELKRQLEPAPRPIRHSRCSAHCRTKPCAIQEQLSISRSAARRNYSPAILIRLRSMASPTAAPAPNLSGKFMAWSAAAINWQFSCWTKTKNR